ncbi:MAG: multiheme c-type cytochrome [Syntrophales bacterium]
MDISRRLAFILLILMNFYGVAAHAGPQSWKHRDIWLKNEQGENITPVRNSHEAYSPRRTCGVCHGYLTITSGYHFQRGFVERGGRGNTGTPTVNCGVSLLTPFSDPLARKINRNVLQMGLSLYDWIGAGGKIGSAGNVISAAAGWYHPGGGLLEYGRNPDGSPDFSKTLYQAEKESKEPLDGDFSSRFTPDKKSHFRQSGVLEADCLICHMDGYRMEARNRQIGARNYRWAAAAGAGLGEIKGAVFTYRDPSSGPGSRDFLAGSWNFSYRPVVYYRWADRTKFTGEGRLKGSVIGKTVESKNCLQCHATMEALGRGVIFDKGFDVHAGAGFRCTDCHGLSGKTDRERLRHQIAGGRSGGRREMKTCEGCHLEGRYLRTRSDLPKEARRPTRIHSEKFPGGSFHFYVIQCTGCHVTAQPARGGYLLDMSAGEKTWYTADRLQAVAAFGDFSRKTAQPWKPWITRYDAKEGWGEQYFPYVPKVSQWFGEKMPDGTIWPISLGYVKEALRKIENLSPIAVRKTDGSEFHGFTAASPRDIERALGALAARGFRQAVFVADRVYELEKGRLQQRKKTSDMYDSTCRIYHDVRPVREKRTYGARGSPEGCLDCHAETAPFFMKMKVLNAGRFLGENYPVPREPNAEPQMYEWGLTSVPAYK